MTVRILAALVPTATQSLRRWLYHLGGLGLILVGLLDNSPLPIPGAMDVATIVLCLHDDALWSYYGLMATLGSVIGGFVTYRLARKGGKEALERRFSPAKVDRVCRIFGRWGFGAIAIPAVLPPPVPMVPFLLAAGAMQYPAGKFLAALTLGRAVRYMSEAYLAARYGRRIIALIAKHAHPAVVGTIVVLAAIVVVVLYFRRTGMRKKGKGK
ncbi:MAG TPA: VTT domain-containing protein [Candidatus Acidoferrales bacterium]|nr:VTT domain-containing protein [Candidatus Acidoferrales bacterium]